MMFSFHLLLDSFKQCQTVALHTLIRLVNQNDSYKDIFRNVGLLEVLINALKEFHDQLKEVYGGTFLGYHFSFSSAISLFQNY